MALAAGDSTDSNEADRGIKRSHEDLVDSDDVSDTPELPGDMSLCELPLELIETIFSFCNGLQQTKLRAVCAAWDAAARSSACAEHVIVDLKSFQATSGDYVLASWIFHCMTSVTKCLIFRNGTSVEFVGAFSALRSVIEIRGFRLPKFMLCDVAIKPQDILAISRTALSENVKLICNRLILKRVRIWGVFNPYVSFPHYGSESFGSYQDLEIPYAVVDAHSETALMDVFERAATDFSDPNLPFTAELDRLSDWIADRDETLTEVRKEEILKVLKTWQNAGPFGPNATWNNVKAANLSANLLTLRRTTVSVLLCLFIKRTAGNYSDEEEEEDEYDNYDESDDYDDPDDYDDDDDDFQNSDED
ncbi:uncharacterized protein LOC129583264 isoform X2 [Paramacrobiotus metropolitanus]|nr:uncharacterized protein LOC129583264 isoform X2 [Paramacrobiotus metropolitanus]XP_055330978.1 uncharacterized protein LOC129583264 isoform X2 [Paramacrobiotus metropolitanus]XP_055330979.1 uncharacterized protein LOC129583264 isoform X2 [Paramacrobiotus metropolitanus]XP_055330980.1 uncharacterized protein LOC129583264 isoform X2 [Paramacrobiotus metropolitanus]XP_055330981.1 uncharacterized protein LOC129583264 isoform X2 [Paramacrobiotus metropolitanus]XP_055330982.1 uncharacterized prot